MYNFLFKVLEDEGYGELFFVQADMYSEAKEIVKKWFGEIKVKFCGKFDDDEADRLGYDTY